MLSPFIFAHTCLHFSGYVCHCLDDAWSDTPSIKPSFKCQTSISNTATQLCYFKLFKPLLHVTLFSPCNNSTRFQMRKLKLKHWWLGLELRSFEPSVYSIWSRAEHNYLKKNYNSLKFKKNFKNSAKNTCILHLHSFNVI